MGIVINQSIRNTILTYIGFVIGAANALFMYTNFLGKTYYGLTAFLLSASNITMPLMAFGVHNTLVKYYSTYKTEEQKSAFLNFMLLLPLILIVPFGLIGLFFYEPIAVFLSRENPIIHDYVWLVPFIGLCMGYFEILYAWAKVQMLSVFGSFVKEIFLRVLISIFLYAVYFKWITSVEFVYSLVGIYFITTCVMAFFAFRIRRPTWNFDFNFARKPILEYSIFIILSGSVAVLLLDIDKFMLGQYIRIENVAYYSVAIFIATVISVPSRAMHQIVYPITAKLMAENEHDELNILYKKTSINLQIIGGYVLLGILVNINQVYLMLPPEYSDGIFVVFIIGVSKYLDLVLGNNNAIIFNSIYYRAVLFLGLLLAVLAIALNSWFIPNYGINGAAVATLIAVTFYSLAKLLFVVFRMKLYPFTFKNFASAGITLALFLGFYYWDFGFIPFFNIVLKSILVTIAYVAVNYVANISSEFNGVLNNVMKMARFK